MNHTISVQNENIIHLMFICYLKSNTILLHSACIDFLHIFNRIKISSLVHFASLPVFGHRKIWRYINVLLWIDVI